MEQEGVLRFSNKSKLYYYCSSIDAILRGSIKFIVPFLFCYQPYSLARCDEYSVFTLQMKILSYTMIIVVYYRWRILDRTQMVRNSSLHSSLHLILTGLFLWTRFLFFIHVHGGWCFNFPSVQTCMQQTQK